MDKIEKVFPASDNSLDIANEFLETELEKFDCPMKTVMQLSLVLEEIFVNIAHYAYPKTTGNVTISITTDENRVDIDFCDTGIPFNPLQKQDPDITTNAEERDIGGLGIFLTKKIVDVVTYEYRNGQNILHISKSLNF